MLPKPIHYQSLKNFRCKSPKLWHTKDVLHYTSNQSVCPSRFWPVLSLKYIYRNWAPSRSCPCRGHRLAALGGLSESSPRLASTIEEQFTTDAASACLAGRGCCEQRVGEGHLMITVLLLSHPGVNLFFQFWHWEKRREGLMPWWKGFSERRCSLLV